MTGRQTLEKSICGPAAHWAAATGAATAMFFGKSSPKTIWATVAISRAAVTATAWPTPAGRPVASIVGSSREAIAGSAR